MKLAASPGTLKRLRRVPWRFQQTLQTPLQNLQTFVATIISGRKQLHAARVTIGSIISEPKHLNAVLTLYSLPPSLERESTIEGTGDQEVAPLLQAAFADSVDFWFVPTPKPFVIYADHDEYATFFANSKSNLNSVVEPLMKQGFKAADYERKF